MSVLMFIRGVHLNTRVQPRNIRNGVPLLEQRGVREGERLSKSPTLSDDVSVGAFGHLLRFGMGARPLLAAATG
jgi:hypothetical protein